MPGAEHRDGQIEQKPEVGGRNITPPERTGLTPEQTERQKLEGLFESIDLASPKYHALSHHIDFWNEYYQKGHLAFRSAESHVLLAEIENWDRNPAYQEEKFNIPGLLRNFVTEITESFGNNRGRGQMDAKPIIIGELKGMKDQIIGRRTQQPPPSTQK